MAHYWGKPATVEQVSRLMRDPRFAGALSSDLPAASLRLGLQAKLVAGSVGRIKLAVDRGVPPLIMVDAGGGNAHFFVVSGYNDQEGVIVCEEYQGVKRLISYEEVEERWAGTGHYMVEVEPSSAESDFRSGAAREAQGKYAEAAELYRRALSAQADHYEARLGLGNCLYRQGKPEEALAEYRKALEISPSDAMALNNVASLLVELRQDTREAERLAERAVEAYEQEFRHAREDSERETEPALREIKAKRLGGHELKLAYAYGTLGQARAANGRHALAVGALKASYNHLPLTAFDARARRLYEIGLSTREMGMPADARGYFRRALEEARDAKLRAKIEAELNPP